MRRIPARKLGPIRLDRRSLTVAGVIVAFLFFTAVASTNRPQVRFGGEVEPSVFTLTPQGDAISPLTPIKVTFALPPQERDGARILTLDPPAQGQYVWQSERTLLYQPDFPGLLRGFTYTAHVEAQPGAGLPRAVQQSFTTDGKLEVASVIPGPDDTDVPREFQVLVQFTRSVAPLTLLSSQPTAAVISFSPPLAGQGEWLNTSLYRFVPDPNAVQPNTKYQLRIAAGLTAQPDGVLDEDYVWAFTTFGPALDSVTPAPFTVFAGPTQPVTLRFNQPMSRASVQANFRLNGPDQQPVPGAFAWSDGDASVTFTPGRSLAPLALYEVLLPEGTLGAGGGATRTAWRSTFKTVGPPSVSSTRPADGAQNADRFGIALMFSNPMDEDSLEDKVAVSGFKPEDVQQSLSPDGLQLFLNASLEPSTAYTVTLAAGAKDRYGQLLPPFRFSFTTGERAPSLVFAVPGQVATYSASTEPILYYHAVNMGEAEFTLYPLTRDEMRQFQLSNCICVPPPVTPGPPPGFTPSQPPLYSWTEDASGPRNSIELKSTSLSRNGAPLPMGDYYVTSGTPNYASQLAFSVVDTGLVTKLSSDELLVWALDLATGQPVPDLTIRASGASLPGGDTAKTDANGLASFKAASQPEELLYQSRRYVVNTEADGRWGVGSTTWQQGIANFETAIAREPYPRKYVAHVYTERPIYRSGEDVLYKGVVRLDDDASYSIPDKADDLSLVIRDSDGVELTRQKLDLDEFGTFAGTLTLAGDAATGDYGIAVEWSVPGQRGTFPITISGSSFLVAEFRRPEFQVSAGTDKQDYVNGETVQASVEASFYFGGAMQGAPVNWSVQANPFTPAFPGFERYSFSDYDYYRQPAVVRAPARQTGSGVTDASGRAVFSVPATISGNEGAQRFEIGATVTDQSAQAVAGTTSAVVHPAALYAGVRPAQYLATAGRETRIEVVSVDDAGKAAASRPVTVSVYQRTWITSKEQTPDGARRYKSEPRDTLIATLDVTTAADGKGSVNYTPTAAGTLRIVAEIRDDAGRTERSAAYLWVSGGQFASWQVANDDTLTLIADKDTYKPGETAEVLVPAPFAGATGLVTIERGKIIDRKVQSFAGNSERLSIPIDDHSVPNIFVSVVLYRPPTADDPVPRFKVGYVELSVSTDTRLLDVSIKPDRDQASPGETVHYDVKVTDSQGKGVKSELSVAVVDKAVLSLTEERAVNGLKAFWFERGLGVATASSLSVSIDRSNDVISELREGGKGGGGLDNDRVRQEFRNTAFWQPQLVTDDKGNASFEVKMPDNLTTWRAQVRAVSGNTMVGEATNELVSTQPLLLRPALPRFLRVGDEADLRLLVRNATKQRSDVTVSLSAEGVELKGPAEQKAQVEPEQSVTLSWPATVNREGTARLTFKGEGSGNLSDAVEMEVPVYLDVTPETTATGGVVEKEARSEGVFIPTYAIQDRGSLAVSVQASITGSLAGDLADFAPFKYEGNERIASRLLATVGVLQADAKARSRGAYSEEQLRSDAASLMASQKQDGGWSWCQTCTNSDPQITGWVLLALGAWQQAGNNVDATVLQRAAGYVDAYVNRFTDVANPADPNQKAFMLSALASSGRGGGSLPAMRALLEQNRAQLTDWGRAYLLLGMADSGLKKDDRDVEKLLDDLAGDVLPSANGNHWEAERIPGSWQTNPLTTALVLNALVRVDPGHPLIEETVRWLSVALSTNVCRTTIERAQAIAALSAFARQTGELGANYAYAVRLDDRDVLAGDLSSEGGAESKSLPLSAFTPGKTSILRLGRDFGQKGRMYYTLDLRYFTPARQVDALNRGIAVSHEYSLLQAPDQAITGAKLGDTVRVEVTVMAPTELNYVVLEDALPAGLEPIDPDLKIVDPALKAQLENERAQANRPPGLDYYAPWLRWYYNPWQQVDLRDDRVILRSDYLGKGVYRFIYYARATTPGDFYVAPAHVEESYFPEVFGRSDSGRFQVSP